MAGTATHSLFAEVLRLKLRLECPEQLPDLHRRAARWYQANGLLLDAVRQAVAADDWPLAAQLVLDELAIGQLIEPHGRNPLARLLPADAAAHPTWTGPQPALIAAALALADVRPWPTAPHSTSRKKCSSRLPADTETPSRLAAAMLCGTVARRTGDLDAAAERSGPDGEAGLEKLPGDLLARHAEIHATVLSARGVVQLFRDTSTRQPRASMRGQLRPPCPGALLNA